jgi:hypothetical protein
LPSAAVQVISLSGILAGELLTKAGRVETGTGAAAGWQALNKTGTNIQITATDRIKRQW